MRTNNRYLIKTSSGFKHFDGMNEVSECGLVIETNQETINCTNSHKFLVGKSKMGKIFRQAQNLKVGDKIGKSIVVNISTDTKRLYYDPVNVQGNNTYIAQNQVHHNCNLLIVDECAFIKPSMWDEFSDAIFPSQSGLSWKKNILISTANGRNHFYDIISGARRKENGYVNFEVPWQEVPRYNSDGSLKTPEDFKEEVIKKYGIVYFEQNYGCIVGSTNINIFDRYTNTYKEVTCEQLKELVDRE